MIHKSPQARHPLRFSHAISHNQLCSRPLGGFEKPEYIVR
jgi:hypothetical protein